MCWVLLQIYTQEHLQAELYQSLKKQNIQNPSFSLKMCNVFIYIKNTLADVKPRLNFKENFKKLLPRSKPGTIQSPSFIIVCSICMFVQCTRVLGILTWSIFSCICYSRVLGVDTCTVFLGAHYSRWSKILSYSVFLHIQIFRLFVILECSVFLRVF